jgi:3-hydroxy-9,10-secoandrosta-1,3,5(10)-triene-9,17-dione monooxygenase reductase component
MTTLFDVARSDSDRTHLYRSVVAEIPKGLTIVATQGEAGPAGSTASAVTSLSLDPLLILVALSATSRTLGYLRDSGAFSVNVLRDRHARLARTFASSEATHQDRFGGVAHHLTDGAPVLDDALAWVTCRLHATHPGGDHAIVVGEVTGMHRAAGEPLVWHRGEYRRVVDPVDGLCPL